MLYVTVYLPSLIPRYIYRVTKPGIFLVFQVIEIPEHNTILNDSIGYVLRHYFVFQGVQG